MMRSVFVLLWCQTLLFFGNCQDNDEAASFENETFHDENIRGHRCSLFMYADPFLWRQVLQMQGHNATAAFESISRLMHSMVREANQVFATSEFYGQGRRIHRGVHFYLADYFIDNDKCNFSPRDPLGTYSDCDEPNIPMNDLCFTNINCTSRHSNLFCNDFKSMRYYLHVFSSQNFGHFCLAYALTYRTTRDFQGIAWIKGYKDNDAKSLNNFGYCAQHDEACQTSERSFYFRNTGAVNLQIVPNLYGEESARNIFIHELGHSFGAKHDDDPAEDVLERNMDDECVMGQWEESFLMTADAKKIVLGNTTKALSACSMIQIGQNLDRVTCWDERTGPERRTKGILFSTSCEYLRKPAEKRKCWRNESARIGVLTVFFVLSALLTTLACLLLCHRFCTLCGWRTESRSTPDYASLSQGCNGRNLSSITAKDLVTDLHQTFSV